MERYSLEVAKENLHFVPNIVPGIGMALNALTNKGDKVMIQPPVYHPFARLCVDNGREVVKNPLKWIDGRLRMDMDDFCLKIKGLQGLLAVQSS